MSHHATDINTTTTTTRYQSAVARDSLELASLASSSRSDRPSLSSDAGSRSSQRLSVDDPQPTQNARTVPQARSYSVSSAFDFAPGPLPLSSSGFGYAVIGSSTRAALDGPDSNLEKQKTLTYLNGLSLIIGLIIGSGIFSSPAQVNSNAGSRGAALIVWVVAGLLAWTGAASFAELGGAIPLNGGARVYLDKIYGEWAGFSFTWCAITVLRPGSTAIIAIIMGEYLVKAFDDAVAAYVNIWVSKAVALLVVAAVTMLICTSTKLTTRGIDFFMFLKLVALVGITIVGVVVAATGRTLKGKANNDWRTIGWFEGTSTDASSWAIALYAGLWAYDGWDNTNYVAGEFINPRRDLPKTIHTALAIVVVAYLLANMSYFFVLPLEIANSTTTIGLAFAQYVFGPLGGLILALVVAGSCFGSLVATMFTTGRLIYGAGRQGYLPLIFGRLGMSEDAIRLPARSTTSTKLTNRLYRSIADDAGLFYTPIYAQSLNAVMTAVYVMVGDFTTLTIFCGLASYIFYFATVLGLIVLRVREPSLERPYRCWITTPVIFCCVSLFLISRSVFARPLNTLVVLAFLAAGVPVYWWRSRHMAGGKQKQPQRTRSGSGRWKFWRR